MVCTRGLCHLHVREFCLTRVGPPRHYRNVTLISVTYCRKCVPSYKFAKHVITVIVAACTHTHYTTVIAMERGGGRIYAVDFTGCTFILRSRDTPRPPSHASFAAEEKKKRFPLTDIFYYPSHFVCKRLDLSPLTSAAYLYPI